MMGDESGSWTSEVTSFLAVLHRTFGLLPPAKKVDGVFYDFKREERPINE
jgi:hypothetical protein